MEKNLPTTVKPFSMLHFIMKGAKKQCQHTMMTRQKHGFVNFVIQIIQEQ